MPIVCGTDFSERAEQALRAATALAALRRDPELWLVHVVDRASTQSLDAVEWDRFKSKRDAHLRADAERLRERYSLRHVYSLTLVGPTSSVLADFARIKGASLIVVASKEREASALFRVGSTPERVAAISTVPTLAVRDASVFEAWSRGERPLRLLLEVDWTRSSAAALRLVKALRAAGPCDVVVVGDHHSHDSAARHGLALDATSEKALRTQRLSRDLATYVGDLGGEGSVVLQPLIDDSQLGAHLLETAQAHGADLVVIGTHRHARLRQLGRAASHILLAAGASVMCVPASDSPAQEEPKLTRRVLIATDLSVASHDTIAAGYGLLAERGGEVHLLHVSRAERQLNRSQHFAQLRELIPAWSAGKGIDTQLEVIESSDIVQTIRDVAARVNADIVCVGTHGRSGMNRLVLGSVAEHVVRQSVRPVLVVRPLPP